MYISDLVERANLYEREEKSITYDGKIIPYTVVRKKYHFSTNKTHSYAEYYIFEPNDDLKELLLDYEEFKEFQVKFLAPSFYKYINDLRWNLYVIFLIKDEESLTDINVSAIENDDNYARKYFFSHEEAVSFLKRDEIITADPSSKNNSLKSGQFQQWIEILDDVHLTGCLTDASLRNENVERYLESGSFEDITILDNSLISSQIEENYTAHVDKIECLNMGKFREHCFKGTGEITFGRANLLQGPNGSGKTSITEGIELAITNDIKRLKDIKEDVGKCQGLNVVLRSNIETKAYFPGLSSGIYKQIDSEWYGVPNVDKSQTTINKNFNRFNYLDADAANRFTREQSINSNDAYDYRDGLKKLFFDNETVNMEKRWLWYNDKFIDKQKKLEKEYSALKKTIEDEYIELNGLENDRGSNKEEIANLLLATKYNNLNLLESENHFQSLRALDETLNALETTILKTINAMKLKQVHCYEDIIKIEKSTLNKIDQINNSNNQLLNEKEKYNFEAKEAKKIKEQKEVIKNNLEKEIEQLEKDIQNWQDIKHIIILKDRLNDLKQYKAKKDDCEKKLSLITDIKIMSGGIDTISNEDLLNHVTVNIDETRDELKSLKEAKIALDEKIENLNLKAGQLDSLRAKMKALGEEYLKINGDDGICPLCGHPHKRKIDLELSINNIILKSNGLEEIRILEIESNRLSNAISEKNAQLNSEIIREEKLVNIRTAYRKICESGLFNLNVTKDDLNYILMNVKMILDQEDILKNEINKAELMIGVIKNEGFTDERIALAEQYVLNNNQYIQYEYENKDINLYSDFLLMNKTKFVNEIELVNENISDLVIKINALQSKFDQFDCMYKEKLNDLEDNQKVLHELSEVKNYYVVIRTHFDITDEDDFYLWAEKYNVLKIRSSSEVKYLQTEISINKLKESIQQLEKSEKLIKTQIDRCKTANTAFDTMPKLDHAVYEFLEDNKERIIYFFQMLHRPKEFESTLEYDEKGYFKLIRKGENDEVRCPQMSTGQRVSFALSVFFSLHLSAKNAPSFIMLDEPVANLDDVHLLNLLDILRDLALNGIQVFFTTANQEVAGLFRRKFSFFEGEFKHLRFDRLNNNPVIIKEITYNPMEDVGKEILLTS